MVIVDRALDETVLRHLALEPVDVLGAVLHHGGNRLGHGLFLDVPELQVAVEAEPELRPVPLLGDDVDVARPLAHRFHERAFHQVHERALADLRLERLLVDERIVLLLDLDADLRVLEELQELVLRRDDLLEEVLQVLQAAVRDLVLLGAEIAGDERDLPVGRIRGRR